MKFGKSLSQKVRDEWKDYAVNYKAMKKALPEKDAYNPSGSASDDGSQGKVDPTRIHTSTNTSTETEAHPKYWAIYRDSQDSVTKFHNDRRAWASLESSTLRSRVEKYRLSKAPGVGSTITTTDNGDILRQVVTNYVTELEFEREFLSINYTAFSKILKKYDKRTDSNVRETKLEELLVSHPFLDGSAMDEFLDKGKELLNDLDNIDGVVRRPSSSGSDDNATCSSRSTNDNDGVSVGKIARTVRKRTTTAATSSMAKDILDKIVKSPFFTKNRHRRNPTFKEKEIEKGDLLGEGEFSFVREVNAFNVNALCPICMIHAFEESEPMASSESTSQVNERDEMKPSASSKLSEDAMEIHGKKSGDLAKKDNYRLTIPTEKIKDIDMESFQDDHEDEDNEIVANRGFMKHHCFRDGSARYAIKQLKRSLKGTQRADGAIDLSIEAKVC